MSATIDGVVEVRFIDLPVAVRRASAAHHDELFREFRLIASGGEGPEFEVPRRLTRLIDELQSQYGRFTASQVSDVEAAEQQGLDTVSTAIRVPPSAGPAAAHLLELLEEADEYCRAGDLLTLEPSLETVRYRTWYLTEVARQLAGAPPTPWGAFAARQA